MLNYSQSGCRGTLDCNREPTAISGMPPNNLNTFKGFSNQKWERNTTLRSHGVWATFGPLKLASEIQIKALNGLRTKIVPTRTPGPEHCYNLVLHSHNIIL